MDFIQPEKCISSTSYISQEEFGSSAAPINQDLVIILSPNSTETVDIKDHSIECYTGHEFHTWFNDAHGKFYARVGEDLPFAKETLYAKLPIMLPIQHPPDPTKVYNTFLCVLSPIQATSFLRNRGAPYNIYSLRPISRVAFIEGRISYHLGEEDLASIQDANESSDEKVEDANPENANAVIPRSPLSANETRLAALQNSLRVFTERVDRMIDEGKEPLREDITQIQAIETAIERVVHQIENPPPLSFEEMQNLRRSAILPPHITTIQQMIEYTQVPASDQLEALLDIVTFPLDLQERNSIASKLVVFLTHSQSFLSVPRHYSQSAVLIARYAVYLNSQIPMVAEHFGIRLTPISFQLSVENLTPPQHLFAFIKKIATVAIVNDKLGAIRAFFEEAVRDMRGNYDQVDVLSSANLLFKLRRRLALFQGIDEYLAENLKGIESCVPVVQHYLSSKLNLSLYAERFSNEILYDWAKTRQLGFYGEDPHMIFHDNAEAIVQSFRTNTELNLSKQVLKKLFMIQDREQVNFLLIEMKTPSRLDVYVPFLGQSSHLAINFLGALMKISDYTYGANGEPNNLRTVAHDIIQQVMKPVTQSLLKLRFAMFFPKTKKNNSEAVEKAKIRLSLFKTLVEYRNLPKNASEEELKRLAKDSDFVKNYVPRWHLSKDELQPIDLIAHDAVSQRIFLSPTLSDCFYREDWVERIIIEHCKEWVKSNNS